MTAALDRRVLPTWAVASALALLFSTAHYVVDWHIGLFGERSDDVSAPQAVLIWFPGTVVAAWFAAAIAAARGSGWGFALLGAIAAGWALAGNGLAIVACPPACIAAFPHQDVAHVGSLVAGAVATAMAWREGRRAGMPWRMVAGAVVIVTLLLTVIFTAEVALAG
jgi:hypothetical protein